MQPHGAPAVFRAWMPDKFHCVRQRSWGGLTRIRLHSDGPKRRRAGHVISARPYRDDSAVFVNGSAAPSREGRYLVTGGYQSSTRPLVAARYKMDAMRAACGHKGTAGGMDCALHAVHLLDWSTSRRPALSMARSTFRDAFCGPKRESWLRRSTVRHDDGLDHLA